MTSLPPGYQVRFMAPFDDGSLVALWITSWEATTLLLGELPAHGGPAQIRVDKVPYDATGLVVAAGQDAWFTAHSRGGGNELLRYARAGGEPEVVPGGVSPSSGFTISHDARRLAYSTCRESIHLARLRPGAAPELISGGGPWRDRYPVVLDDRHLLFTSDRSGGYQIWRIDLTTGQSVPAAGLDTSFPAVSPDHQLLAYCEHGSIRVRSIAAGGSGIGDGGDGGHGAGFGGGEARVITSGGQDTLVNFTHDGKALVYEHGDATGTRTWVAPLDGTPPRAITPPGSSYGSPSPVDDRVVFLLPQAGGGSLQVMMTTLAGAPPVPLSPLLPPGHFNTPVFSRDGRNVLVVSRNVEVLEVPVDGSSPPRVLHRMGLEGLESVQRAPDGDGLLAAVVMWEGDLWLAEGEFR